MKKGDHIDGHLIKGNTSICKDYFSSICLKNVGKKEKIPPNHRESPNAGSLLSNQLHNQLDTNY